jgi:predicted rRNA methylase YqxC with S4 and FtsJ domains
MSELWKNLIAQEDPALAEALELSRVSISKKTGEMRVRLNSEKLLSDAQFDCAQRRIAAAFPAVRVKVSLEYPALRQRVLEDITAFGEQTLGLTLLGTAESPIRGREKGNVEYLAHWRKGVHSGEIVV